MNIDESYMSYYAGEKSDHFDGERFFNPWNPRPKKGLLDVLKWRMERGRADWPESVENPPRPPLEQSSDALMATYIGHATFLVQAKGRNILVDPFFSERASPFSGLGPKRVRPPFVPLEALPRIDTVFVSHNHYDHLDLPSLSWLAANHKPAFLTPLGNTRILKSCADGGCALSALDWHQAVDLADGLSLTVTPAQHWSRRGLNDINRDLWGGFILKSGGSSLYYSSDTGFHAGMFQDINTRYGAPDIALLPIGAYAPRWFMKYSHMEPAEAVEAHRLLRASQTMAFHHETLQLSDEPFEAPRDAIRTALKKTKMAENSFVVPYPGDRTRTG